MRRSLLEELAKLVGHRLTEDNRRLFEDGLRKTALALAVSPSEAARRALEHDRIAYRELVTSVTVHETYFFRHPGDFEVACQHAAWMLSQGRPVRHAWSVGCSTGEEAYSLAIALAPTCPELVVLGTDISVEALEVARLGRYGSWSFRERKPHTISELLRSGGLWEVNPQLRSRVHFREANLAYEPVVPTPPLPPLVDLIFCRNVLLYFTPNLAQRIFQKLCEAVAEGGLLVLGPLEGPTHPPPGFERLEGAQVLRRILPGCPVVPPRPAPTLPPVARARMEPPPPPPSTPRPSAALREARRLADQGDLNAALERAGKLEPEPEALYLSASILFERGDLLNARKLLQRLLTLCPDFIPAHLHLALVALRRGDTKNLSVQRDALQRLLRGRADDDDVGIEGMKVAYVRSVMETLDLVNPAEK